MVYIPSESSRTHILFKCTWLECPLWLLGLMNPTNIHEDAGSISVLRIQHCCKGWHRSLMWLRSGIAIAVTQPGRCSSDLSTSLGACICCRCVPYRKKKGGGVHGTFPRIDHMLGHKASLHKFKKTEIISSIFSDHNTLN